MQNFDPDTRKKIEAFLAAAGETEEARTPTTKAELLEAFGNSSVVTLVVNSDGSPEGKEVTGWIYQLSHEDGSGTSFNAVIYRKSDNQPMKCYLGHFE